MKNSLAAPLFSAAMLAVALAPANAELITGWGSAGFTVGTVTETGPGAFVATPTGNLAPRAIFTPIDFSAIGSVAILSGTATIQNAAGNVQFRFGLYDTNDSSTAEGWLGYFGSPRAFNGTGGSAVYGRSNPNTAVFSSGTGSYFPTATELVQTGTSGGGGIFDFTLTLTRQTANSVSVAFSFVQTGGGSNGDINISGSYTDTGGSALMSKVNAVGFLTNTNTGQVTVTNLSVIPEPSTYAAIFGLAALGAALLRRRMVARR
jgi:hypothetical protein